MILQELGTNPISSPQQAQSPENGSIHQAVSTIDKCLQGDREIVDLAQKLGVNSSCKFASKLIFFLQVNNSYTFL